MCFGADLKWNCGREFEHVTTKERNPGTAPVPRLARLHCCLLRPEIIVVLLILPYFLMLAMIAFPIAGVLR